MMRRVLLLILATAVLATAGCLGGDDGDPSSSMEKADAVATDRVIMESNKYVPAGIRVAANTTVTWVNEDMAGHTVTPADEAAWGGPGSGNDPDAFIKNGETWTWTFTEPGTYYYYCYPHGSVDQSTGKVYGMKGVVYVEAADGGA